MSQKINKKEIVSTIVCFLIAILFFVIIPRYKKPIVSNTTPAPFVGTWTVVGSTNFENSVVSISNQTATGFTFSFDAQSGADSGSWSNFDEDSKTFVGTMTLGNNTAHYVDDPASPTYHYSDGTKDDPCTADFTLSKNNTTLDVVTNCAEFYAGFGVSFDGTYAKDATIATTTIATADVFAGKSDMYKNFVSLVGNYLDTFNQTVALEDDENSADPQLGNITTATFAVPHAYTEAESIVVLGAHNSMWAAVIDWDDANQKSIVRYFTNQSAWKIKLPQAITDWMANFSDDVIIYESK